MNLKWKRGTGRKRREQQRVPETKQQRMCGRRGNGESDCGEGAYWRWGCWVLVVMGSWPAVVWLITRLVFFLRAPLETLAPAAGTLNRSVQRRARLVRLWWPTTDSCLTAVSQVICAPVQPDHTVLFLHFSSGQFLVSHNVWFSSVDFVSWRFGSDENATQQNFSTAGEVLTLVSRVYRNIIPTHRRQGLWTTMVTAITSRAPLSPHKSCSVTFLSILNTRYHIF